MSLRFSAPLLVAGGFLLSLPAHAQARFDLRAEPDVIPANGLSTTSIFVQLPGSSSGMTPNSTVRFATTAGTIESQATLTGGVARVLLRSSNTPETATVTAFVNGAREGLTMRHARFTGERRIEIVSGAEPSPAAGEARLRVLGCALCGSDMRVWRQGWPVTPGHEIVGVVEEPGHALEGRRVVVYIPVFCGRCPECRRGDTHLCTTHASLVGWQRDGGYAERLAVPSQCLLPVPDDIETALAPLLLDVIGTPAHAIRLARRVAPSGRVAVLGAGADRPRGHRGGPEPRLRRRRRGRAARVPSRLRARLRCPAPGRGRCPLRTRAGDERQRLGVASAR